jgi:hypothetical protein
MHTTLPVLLLLRRRQVGAMTLAPFGGHAGFAQRRVLVDGLGDAGGLPAHLDGEAGLTAQFARRDVCHGCLR